MIVLMFKSTKQWIVASAAAGTLLGAVGVAVAATGGAPAAAPQASNDEVVFATPAVATQPQQTPSTTAPPSTTKPDKGPRGDKPAETPLTGDTAEKVKAAALAAVPGATVDRVETDSDGSPYEAHVTKSDGSRVTVKVDSTFKVTAIEADGDGRHGDHGGPGRGGHGDETALTGDTAEKVKAAALAAVPGATVDRVETDSDGSPYEAHVTKSDGSR